jgi:hypothetical protein
MVRDALRNCDPFTDIALNTHGTWGWSASKGDLRAHLTRYFEDRKEDGFQAP